LEDRISGTVAISKHLCGCATDLTLRCLLNYRKTGGDIKGIVIALCCHQLCTYESYINREYLTTNSISKELFEYIALVSTWAICGPSKSQEKMYL
jgi:tRNA:m4X modification enzyme